MSRAALLAELEAYAPSDDREREMTVRCVHFVRENPACFERTNTAGHITASAWLLDDECRHVLLTHHRKLDRWLQLGGHADGDDDVRRVALHEAREESGLAQIRFISQAIFDVDVHVIPARPGEPAHVHYDVRFALMADRRAPTVVSAESHALAWKPVAQLDRDGVDESVRRLARKTSALAAAID